MLERLRAAVTEMRTAELPPLTVPSPEANNRAIAELTPEYIEQCVENFRKGMALKFANNVQLELPFAEELIEPVV